MGCTTSKQTQRTLELFRPCLDSGYYPLLPNQHESINSNASDREGTIKWDYIPEKFHSNKDETYKHLSDQVSLSRQVPSVTSSGPEILDTSVLMDDQKDTWQLVGPSNLTSSHLNPEISSSEIASDDVPPQQNKETKPEKSPLSSKCHETHQRLGIVRARANSFERKIAQRRMKRESLASSNQSAEKKKVVFYITSITGISSTYEDCQDAKRILQGYGVCLDVRDVSMDACLKNELNELLGKNFQGKLPRVFVHDCYIGGAEEVRKLHSSGELQYILKGCEMKKVGEDGNFELCPGCADERFLPCLSCSGSRRVYLEDREKGECTSNLFYKCEDCNEYGLIRCPVCW